MGWFDKRWRPKLAQKAARAGSGGFALLTGATPALQTRGLEASIREAYGRNVIGQRSVKMVAEAVAGLKLTSAGGEIPPLLRRPNPLETGPEFLERLTTSLALTGEAFVERLDGPNGEALELHSLRPDRVQIELTREGWPSAFLYKAGGPVSRYLVDPATGRSAILHLRSVNPLDDHRGLSPLDAARGAIDIHNAAAAWNIALLTNAARPSGALVYNPGDGSTLSPEQYERLKNEMEASFAGERNAGRPLLLDGGLSWQQLSFSPTDMDFMATKHAAAREIALAFGVPPLLLGLPGDNTYANYQEASRAFWRMTVLPLAEKILAGINRHVFSDADAVAIDRDAITALAADRERLWRQVAAADFMTADEKRAALGLPPLAPGHPLAPGAARAAR